MPHRLDRPHRYFDVPRPTVIGHRGAAAEAPENTLLAFERGVAAGAHILESDVHVTGDGIPVLSHDPSLERMTGSPVAIADLTFVELGQLDAGLGFAGPTRSTSEPAPPVRIPSLAEAFTAFPTERFNLEIKSDAAGLVERVTELIAEHDRAERTLLAAENDALMERIRSETRRRGVDVAIGASVGDVLAFVRAAVEGVAPESEAMALQIPIDFAGRPLITRELVEHAHAHGAVVHAWTINETDEMDRLVELGVDGIVTDDPARMHAHFHGA